MRKLKIKFRYKNFWAIVCIVIGLIVFFNFILGLDRGFNFDEERSIRNLLSSHGYQVVAVGLNGTSAYVEMTTSSFKNEQSYRRQIWNGLSTLAIIYEVEPSEIEEMSKKELIGLGIDYDEIPYMSDEELAEVSEIVGKRASFYIVKIHLPLEVCSYKLSRATYKAWSKASDIDEFSNLTNNLYKKMNREMEESESCS